MRQYLTRAGLAGKDVLKSILAGLCLVLAGCILQGNTGWTEVSLVDGYSQIFFVSIGSVPVPLMYCALQRKAIRRQMEPLVAIRYDCRLSWAENVAAGCFIRAAVFAISMNMFAVGALLLLGCYPTNWAWMILGSILLQILFLFNLSALQILVLAHGFSGQVAFAGAVLYGAFDFIALNTMMEPIYIGWGTVLWWQRSPIWVLYLPMITVALVVALEVSLHRMNLLDRKKE